MKINFGQKYSKLRFKAKKGNFALKRAILVEIGF